MLDIRNVSDDDKLFNFISGLQGWAQSELKRQGVCDLPAAMAVADYLVDYKMCSAINTIGKSKTDGGKKGKVVTPQTRGSVYYPSTRGNTRECRVTRHFSRKSGRVSFVRGALTQIQNLHIPVPNSPI